MILFLTAFIFESKGSSYWMIIWLFSSTKCRGCISASVQQIPVIKGEQICVFLYRSPKKEVIFHIRTNLSVSSSLLPTPTVPITACFIVWNASGFKKVFYLKQEYYLNMFYCIFIAPLVLLQFSTSKQRLHHLHVDYANMSDICNLIGLQLKKCFLSKLLNR